MVKFIIQVEIRYGDVWKKYYHQNIYECDSKLSENVYMEGIVSLKKEAKVFFSLREADCIVNLFSESYKRIKVIKIK